MENQIHVKFITSIIPKLGACLDYCTCGRCFKCSLHDCLLNFGNHDAPNTFCSNIILHLPFIFLPRKCRYLIIATKICYAI